MDIVLVKVFCIAFVLNANAQMRTRIGHLRKI